MGSLKSQEADHIYQAGYLDLQYSDIDRKEWFFVMLNKKCLNFQKWGSSDFEGQNLKLLHLSGVYFFNTKFTI